jgi:hypothetical protein
MGAQMIRAVRPIAAPTLAALLAAGCFVTTDENLWKQRKEAGADVNLADVSWQEAAADRGPIADYGPGLDGIRPDGLWPDGPAIDGPAIDGPANDGPSPDTTPVPDVKPQPDTNKDPNGTPCTGGGTCSTGFCVDNVCCNAACQGPCEACNLSGKKGICSPSPAGTDPDNDCQQDPVNTCGLDGSCDGSGACRKYITGTVCGTPICSGAATYSIKKCSATGSCASGLPLACLPYKCQSSTGQCYTSCTSDAQCSLYKCNTATSKCYSSCTSGAQCQTNKCIGGGKCK